MMIDILADIATGAALALALSPATTAVFAFLTGARP